MNLNRTIRILFVTIAATILACAGRQAARYEFSLDELSRPPGGLKAEQVPLFLSFGSDDNPYSGLEGSGGAGGMHYLTELFRARRHADGTPLHYSFYVNTMYITPNGMEEPMYVKRSWKDAIDSGHEIGVHTHSHPHGKEFSVRDWEKEIELCIDHLKALGISRNQLAGFRTPFLEYSDRTLTAVQNASFVYDCSLEEGFQEGQDGRNFLWPYRLDHGAPGNAATFQRLELPLVREHPGLWEIPVYAFLVPPDELCERYGVAPGLRARLKRANDYFDVDQGKITGMDWNLWFEFGMDKAEFLATLQYTLDQRLKGNRCPLTVGLHSAIYADRSPDAPPKTTVEERRDALREFLDYALTKPEVRVVSARELLAWLQSPSPLPSSTTPAATERAKLGAGFRFSIYGPRRDPGPAYWTRVAREMASRFPGAAPEAIWIIGKKTDRGIQMPFPVGDTGDPLIESGEGVDRNEAALTKFDEAGVRIWLQIEPRFASVDKLLHLTLQRYGHHRCVIGVGIDVEWYKSTDPDGGEAVTDEEARRWLAIARSYNSNYRLFLKHWLTEKMPPTVRDGLVFIDDSQIFETMDPMIDEFAVWAKTFAPAPVGYQYGYMSDRIWWSKLKDPPKEIGDRILQVAPNAESLFWVDFSVLEVFPE